MEIVAHWKMDMTSDLKEQEAAQAFRSTLVLLLKQVIVADDMITARPGHETLWYHKRKLFVLILGIITQQYPQVNHITSEISREIYITCS